MIMQVGTKLKWIYFFHNNFSILENVRQFSWSKFGQPSNKVGENFYYLLISIHVFVNFSSTCEHLAQYERNYDYDRLRRSQSVAPPELTFVQDTESVSRTVMVFYTASVFKIRVDGNASLEKEDWNSWSPGRRFTVKQHDRPNQRKDLRC